MLFYLRLNIILVILVLVISAGFANTRIKNSYENFTIAFDLKVSLKGDNISEDQELGRVILSPQKKYELPLNIADRDIFDDDNIDKIKIEFINLKVFSDHKVFSSVFMKKTAKIIGNKFINNRYDHVFKFVIGDPTFKFTINLECEDNIIDLEVILNQYFADSMEAIADSQPDLLKQTNQQSIIKKIFSDYCGDQEVFVNVEHSFSPYSIDDISRIEQYMDFINRFSVGDSCIG